MRALQLVLWLVLAWPALGSEYCILYAGGSTGNVNWLAPGAAKDDPGSPSGRLRPGTTTAPHQMTINTYEGHTFRFRGQDKWLSSPFSHDGGPINLVILTDTAQLLPESTAAARADDHAVSVEELNGPLLQLMLNRAAASCGFGTESDQHVADCVERAGLRTSSHNVLLPLDVLQRVWKHYSPAQSAPSLDKVVERLGSTPPNQIFVLNRAAAPVQVSYCLCACCQIVPSPDEPSCLRLSDGLSHACDMSCSVGQMALARHRR